VRPLSEIVDELPEQPASHHANHRGPVQRLREHAVTRICIDQLHRQNFLLGKFLTAASGGSLISRNARNHPFGRFGGARRRGSVSTSAVASVTIL
jgi:hypothetical protein